MELLFGEGRGESANSLSTEVALVLPHMLAMFARQRAVERLERRLETLRHDAIEGPALATFQPLVRLRRNIADMQVELRRRKTVLPKDENAYRQLRENLNDASDYPESLAECYTILKRTNDATSKALDYEMQLVIGSVTVQVRNGFLYLTIFNR